MVSKWFGGSFGERLTELFGERFAPRFQEGERRGDRFGFQRGLRDLIERCARLAPLAAGEAIVVHWVLGSEGRVEALKVRPESEHGRAFLACSRSELESIQFQTDGRSAFATVSVRLERLR